VANGERLDAPLLKHDLAAPVGELSDPQQSVISAALASGGRVGVVRDAEEMLGLLDAWGIPQGPAVMRV
jgi:hypothetical protein